MVRRMLMVAQNEIFDGAKVKVEAASCILVSSWGVEIEASLVCTALSDFDTWNATFFSKMSRSARLKARP